VAPLAAARVELVVAEQPVPVGGQQVDRVDQEVGDRVGDEPVEADPDPARLDAQVAEAGLLAQGP
jgi:hypothetical protein